MDGTPTTTSTIDEIISILETDTSGILNIHDKTGVFYMSIIYANLESYKVIIEQDLNSIPEFPSSLILPLFVVATVSIIMLEKNL